MHKISKKFQKIDLDYMEKETEWPVSLWKIPISTGIKKSPKNKIIATGTSQPGLCAVPEMAMLHFIK